MVVNSGLFIASCIFSDFPTEILGKISIELSSDMTHTIQQVHFDQNRNILTKQFPKKHNI